MSRQELPRVYELRDRIKDPRSPNAYFQDFDNSIANEPLKKQVWRKREQELRGLDPESWEFLKNEVVPYLEKRDPNGRGWQQFITILNQARAYKYLKRIGCSSVKFISPTGRVGKKTPDLEGLLNNSKILCEVKTINISDEEALARLHRTPGTTSDRLEAGFFNKLRSDLEKATKQMKSYDDSPGVRRMAYVLVNFDDFLAEYKDRYYQQVDQYLSDSPVPEIEIVFHNQETGFHNQITMQHATVFNEAG
jgi:hypothetical protein